MEDNFRYMIVEDMLSGEPGKSCTTQPNIYAIPKQGSMKKAVRLIDVPGLGDTAGIKKDEENIEMIKKKFESSINSLNLVIYVFKAS